MDTAQYWFQAASDYQIERSLRFNSADSAYLNRTPASAGNRKTYTISMWIKRAKLGASSRLFGAYSSGSAYLEVFFTSSDTLQWYYWNGSGYSYNRVTSQVFRDPSAWCHLVFVFNSPSAIGNQRIRIYFNGQEITTFSSSTDPSQNFDCIWNSTANNVIGDLLYGGSPSATFDGLMTEVHHIDGQALTPSSFGETDTITGVWKPKRYSGTYGTNGFYLNFADNSGTTSTTLGKDSSGNGNNWTPNNFSVTPGAGNDSMIDTPTPYADGGNGRGNYCTANPINSNASTLRNGNLEFIGDTGASLAKGILGTIGVSSGKWYFEVTPDSGGTFFIGVAPANGVGVGSVDLEYINGAYSYRGNGDKCQGTGGTGTFTAYGSSYVSPDVIGVALDLDNGAIYFAKNNTWQNSGVPTSGSSKTGAAFTSFSGSYTPMACGFSGATATLNFGQRSFSYTPPAGFLALNTNSLPEPTIKKPSSYMDVVLDTGANILAAAQSKLTTGADLIWIKDRANGNNHQLIDTVRGGTLTLQSNTIGQETTYSAPSGSSVAWCWDESATPGFDIVTYTGTGVARTIAHSLGVAPSMMIVKRRDSSPGDWWVYHSALGATKSLVLDSTSAQQTLSFIWNDTAPTSSVFSLGIGSDLNGNGGTFVAYLWSEVAGFSKFGSYTGNGSSDGPFVYCGFRPRWVMVKSSSNITNWYVFDTARNEYNLANKSLFPNSSNEEHTGGNEELDIVSNGFKMRNASSGFNVSGYTYIFAAFAESPFKYSLAR